MKIIIATFQIPEFLESEAEKQRGAWQSVEDFDVVALPAFRPNVGKCLDVRIKIRKDQKAALQKALAAFSERLEQTIDVTYISAEVKMQIFIAFKA